MNNKSKEEVLKLGTEQLKLKTGGIASYAGGSILASYGETVVLATVCVSEKPKEGADFFPMLVDYEERLYAAGKISGSRWRKREGRPSDEAILAARLIDRPLRPLFPKDYRNDLQIIITVLSYDGEHDPDATAIIAASTALLSAGVPFFGPVAAARVGLIKDNFLLNPTTERLKESKLELMIAATKDKIMMIEAKGQEVSEETVLKAIEFGQKQLKPVFEIQEAFRQEAQKTETETKKLVDDVKKMVGKKLEKIVLEVDKEKREAAISAFEEQALQNLEGDYKQADIKQAFAKILENKVRGAILEKNIRPDGRALSEIRPVSVETNLLPRTHGSSLFSRGQTQVLSIVTLGAPGDEQFIETMELETKKRFMHHYNFPPFSTGEVKPLRSVSRREVGHGALAEKALEPLIPEKEEFPYTIRIVSEVLSSNGSTSMASVCAASMALMDAGVPVKRHAAGISIGLVTGKDGKEKLLTDIQGIEDFAGDMDFKVAGTREGITALQLDTKTKGLSLNTIKGALGQAKEARLEILSKMEKVLPKPKPELSAYAPRIEVVKINPDKIRDVIGPGGKTINKIIEETGVSIDVEQDGTVSISSIDADGLKKAKDWVLKLTKEAKPGELYKAKVVRITDFGAFCEIWPGQEGMVHISELAPYRVRRVSDVVKVGQIVNVKVINIDELGRVNLSVKQANDKKT